MPLFPASVAPRRFRQVAAAAGFSQALIVLSGAAVRLTQAGLGCEDWPTCNDDRILPEWELHGWIEFGNRLISLAVVATCVAAVFSAYRRTPRRPDLIRYSWGLVIGTLIQVVLGGITVLVDLHPIVVSVHFLVSMGLLWCSVKLWVLAGSGPGSATPIADARTALGGRVLVVMATTVLVSGTVVTGTGPNSGDSRADRLAFELRAVVRIHSVLVWLFLAMLVIVVIRAYKQTTAHQGDLGPAFKTMVRTMSWLLTAVIAQGALGYTQYELGVPATLVELHILGAVTVWCLTILLYQRMFERPPIESHGGVKNNRAPAQAR